MDLGLKNRVALVVGASDGIGAATAMALSAEGAQVALVGRRREALGAVAQQVARRGGLEPMLLTLDASVAGALDDAVEQVVARYGALHGLAVIAAPMGPRAPITALSNADWRHYFDHSVMIAVQACRAALPHLSQEGGAIVTTAAYSLRAQKGDLVAYTAAKAAIASLTKNIAMTHGVAGVRANCIAPGVVEKDAATRTRLAAELGVPEERARYEYVNRNFGMSVALERAGRHEEFADLIAFLLSQRSSYISGALINIDGGTDF